MWTQYTVAISDAHGYFVEPGPAASPRTVRAQTMPDGSIAGAPLAYEMKLGLPADQRRDRPAGRRPRTPELVDIGSGGAGWTEYEQG